MANRRTRRARRLGIEESSRTDAPGRVIPTPDLSGLPEGAEDLVAAMQSQPMVIVAGMVGVAALTNEARSALLRRIDVQDALARIVKIQAEWDVASTTHWNVKSLQRKVLSTATGAWVPAVRAQVEAGNILTSPQVTVGLMRELIETESSSSVPLSGDDLVHLLVSIASEQQNTPGFAGDVPTAAELAALDEQQKSMTPEELIALNHETLSWLGASALFNAPRKIEGYKADAYDFWYSKWEERASDTLGQTPAETFEAATGIGLDQFLRAGRIIGDAVMSGQTVVSVEDLSDDAAVRDFIVKSMSMSLDGYRDVLTADRASGDVKLQRYSFTRFPLLDLGDGTLQLLRGQWAIERFFGDPLVFDVVAGFSAKGDKTSAKRFAEAVKYQFEDVVGRVVARIAERSAMVQSLVTEPELQAEWTEKKGNPPSVCDWVLRCGRGHVLIEATHHAVKASLAQGLGDGAEYSADADKILTKRKFEQFASVMRLVRRLGWSGHPCPEAFFIPFVVVPNSGTPSSVHAELDYRVRASAVLAEFLGSVTPPTVVQLQDLQLLEGLGEWLPTDLMMVIAAWRQSPLPLTLQDFLDLQNWPRPVPKHIFEAAVLLDERLERAS